MDPTAQARLFIALWPDAATREAIDACSRALPWPEHARRVAADRLHLTVHFLGGVERERLPAIGDAIDMACGTIELSFDRLDLWNRQTAVLLASTTPPALAELHAALGVRLQQIGLPTESRPLRPHVTLGRRAAGLRSHEFGPGLQALRWRSSGFALVESRAGYRDLRRYG